MKINENCSPWNRTRDFSAVRRSATHNATSLLGDGKTDKLKTMKNQIKKDEKSFTSSNTGI